MRGPRIIGLTGPSGAGKSTVAAHFAAKGIPVIDADRVYHSLLIPPSPCLQALTEAFSPAILAADGTLDRTALSAIVFADSDAGRAALSRLNEITHRFVIEKTQELLASYHRQGYRTVVIDAPLLIEAGMHQGCDLTVCVLSPIPVRVRRLMARDGKSEAEILSRIRAQKEDDFYLANTDVVIRNDDTTTDEQLRQRVRDILSRVEGSV